MKIAGFLIVGRGEADRYLPNVLKRLEPLCDRIFIWGNNPDKRTDALCKKYDYCRYPQDQWGKKQWLIKEIHLKRNVKPYNPDWIICVDADEILDKNFTREKAEEMATWGEIAYEFYCVQLWDRENQMRIDGGWGNFWNVRYYKFIPEASLDFVKRPLHCGLAPVYAYNWCAKSGMIFKHYGYMKKEDREKKWERYQKFDPEMKYFSPNWYKSILGGKPKLQKFNEDRFSSKLKYIPRQPQKRKYFKKKIMEKTYYVKNKFGTIYAVKESMLEEHLKRPGIELLEEYKNLEDEIERTLREMKEENVTAEDKKKAINSLPKPDAK